MWFDTWSDVLRILAVGAAAYATLVLVLRVSGKRTLAKLNAFDFVVTVALGSTLATILLSKQVALAEGVLALALLVGLQWLITWSSSRSAWVTRLVKSEPRLLVYRGRLLGDALRRERVIEAEVLAAVRREGYTCLDEVGAVVLETDASFSVLPREEGPLRALRSVKAPPDLDLAPAR